MVEDLARVVPFFRLALEGVERRECVELAESFRGRPGRAETPTEDREGEGSGET